MYAESDLERARTRWDVIAADVPMRRKGRELVGLCPFHNEKTPSFAIVVDKGFYHCHGCGAHGTAIDYVMAVRGLDFLEAVQELLGLPQLKPKDEAATAAAPRQREIDHSENIRRILDQCVPIASWSPGRLYLISRGIRQRQIDKLELFAHEALPYAEPADGPREEQDGWRRWQSRKDGRWYRGREFPALVAPIASSKGEIIAIQRIWVSDKWFAGTADSRAPVSTRKKSLGDLGDGAVRLRPAGPLLGLAEGVETAAATMELNLGVPTWAVCGTARLGFPAHWRERTPPGQRPRLWFAPVKPPAGVPVARVEERAPSIWIPPEVNHLLIYGDNGETGQIVARYAAWWWRRHGLEADAIFPPDRFDDFNSQLLGEMAA
jgi:DNA primase